MKAGSVSCFVIFFVVLHCKTAVLDGISANAVCKEEGRIRNPNDCNSYYTCLETQEGDFVAIEMECPEAYLTYDEARDQCLSPDDVEECKDYKPGNDTQFDNPCEKEGNVRNLDDCNSYYACIPALEGGFLPIEMPCSTNELAFDEEENRCRHPENVEGCEDYKPDSNEDNGEQTPFNCKDEGNTRNPDDCNCFYSCKRAADGNLYPVKMSCEEDFAFHEEKNMCLNPKDVEGCEDYIPETDSGEQTEFSCVEEGSAVNPDDCTSYFVCSRLDDGSWEMKEKHCDEGFAYHEDTTECLKEENIMRCKVEEAEESEEEPEAVTDTPTVTNNTCTKEGNIRDPDDCNSYYYCKETQDGGFDLIPEKCPTYDLAYDEEEDECLDPKEVKGCEDWVPETSEEDEGQNNSTLPYNGASRILLITPTTLSFIVLSHALVLG